MDADPYLNNTSQSHIQTQKATLLCTDICSNVSFSFFSSFEADVLLTSKAL